MNWNGMSFFLIFLFLFFLFLLPIPLLQEKDPTIWTLYDMLITFHFYKTIYIYTYIQVDIYPPSPPRVSNSHPAALRETEKATRQKQGSRLALPLQTGIVPDRHRAEAGLLGLLFLLLLFYFILCYATPSPSHPINLDRQEWGVRNQAFLPKQNWRIIRNDDYI